MLISSLIKLINFIYFDNYILIIKYFLYFFAWDPYAM